MILSGDIEGLTELRLVESLHQRKRLMLEETDAVVALPGGSGTLEELFEAITWKRLGLFVKPIILVNVRGFFNPCIELLETCIRERFMNDRHRAMWTVVEKTRGCHRLDSERRWYGTRMPEGLPSSRE